MKNTKTYKNTLGGLFFALIIVNQITCQTEKKTMKKLNINLAMSQSAEGVFCTMTFLNIGESDVFLSKSDICFTQKITSEIFKINQNQQEVPYVGIMLKRGVALENDFVILQPNQHITTSVRLDKVYAFLPGHHTYTIQYSCYHSSPEENPQLNKFESKIVSFDYSK
jgi:hypothetical protein